MIFVQLKLSVNVLFFLLFIGMNQLYAQEDTFDSGLIEHSYQLLSRSKTEIQNNNLLNELILDEVSVMILDSILIKPKERYRFFGAGLLALVGMNWRAVRMDKRKYVGTVKKSYGKLKKDRLTELDVNFDIYSNINRYREIAHLGYLKQKEIGRQKRKKNYLDEPYTNPEEPKNIDRYALHCELTVPELHRYKINQTFYPCVNGFELKTHKNFLDPNPSFGMYGPISVDCFHSCHPELHPYEWIWWYDLRNKSVKNQAWYFGLFVEGSKRFPNWAGKQKTGKITIPFSFKKGKELYTIKVEHLVIGELDRNALIESGFIDKEFMTFGDLQNYINLPINEKESIDILVESNIPFNYGGLVYKISNVKYVNEDKLIEGVLEIAASTSSAYCAKVSFVQ